ncbi:PLP-dependent aminotransferase family protein [Dokdonella sp.]|uniref:aminotransferase-like domain-containing protein n=1 Tax=Dokdonella sp. TaxID=2291710 RepID=UPI001B021535|nr:PLP-dependent aminotransferase family protein [Dokdonella sp.]MBO9663386.1 PLP-dependent aminotransferase family protein [Dokdonella sp.]
MSLLYERVAESLRGQIRRGVLRAGERLPSLRRVGRQQQVSLATAVEAYVQLEREGLVEARPRSGYYVRGAAPDLPEPALRRTPRAPCAMRNPALLDVLDVLTRSDLLPLHAATPSLELLPAAGIAAAVARTMRRHRDAALRYAMPQGQPGLRLQIARRYAHCGVDVDPDEIVVTAGAMEAISLALRSVTRSGDVVLLETPTYYGLLQAVAALGLRVVEVPNRPGAGIDVAQLEGLLARHEVRAAVLVPNFNNPVGSLTGDAGKQAIVAACAARCVVLIEDDLYGELAYSGTRPPPLRRFDRQGGVITCGSFSKMLAPGLRVGWAFGSRWTDELLRAKCFSSVATASLPQLAIADYLAHHDVDRPLRRLRRELAANAQRYRDVVARYWPAGTRVSEPVGGMALWLELADGVDAQALFEAALAQGIGTLPGHLFSNRDEYRHHLRLSCGLLWDAKIEQALRAVGALADRLRKEK